MSTIMMSLFAQKIKPSEKICPYVRGPCLKHGCEMWIKVEGSHPQTGKMVDVWTCSIKEVPTFLMYVGSSINKLDGEMSAYRREQSKILGRFTTFFEFLEGLVNGNKNIGRRASTSMDFSPNGGRCKQTNSHPSRHIEGAS